MLVNEATGLMPTSWYTKPRGARGLRKYEITVQNEASSIVDYLSAYQMNSGKFAYQCWSLFTHRWQKISQNIEAMSFAFKISSRNFSWLPTLLPKHRGSLSLTWINVNSNKDKLSHVKVAPDEFQSRIETMLAASLVMNNTAL